VIDTGLSSEKAKRCESYFIVEKSVVDVSRQTSNEYSMRVFKIEAVFADVTQALGFVPCHALRFHFRPSSGLCKFSHFELDG
jgi:hypothetical protein